MSYRIRQIIFSMPQGDMETQNIPICARVGIWLT